MSSMYFMLVLKTECPKEVFKKKKKNEKRKKKKSKEKKGKSYFAYILYSLVKTGRGQGV